MRLAALDLATKSGVCCADTKGGPMSFATWDMKGLKLEAKPFSLERRIRLLVEAHGIEACAIEAPLMPHKAGNKGTSAETAIMLNGMVFVAIGVCHEIGIRHMLIERQDALQAFTGRRMYPIDKFGKDAAKKACMARCEQMRWPAEDYDQADSAAIWWAAMMEIDKAAAMSRRQDAPVLF